MSNHTDETTTHNAERGDGMNDAQRYSNGQREWLEAIEELLTMDADMLRAIVDVCNCAVSGAELDAVTEETPVDVSGYLVQLVGEHCNGDTDADDIIPEIMDDHVLEVKVTRTMGDTDPEPREVTLLVTLGGPHCEYVINGTDTVRIVTYWGSDTGRNQAEAGSFAGWWWDLVTDMGAGEVAR
jgi:hypothetical protein